eukprot:8441918-Pyramimonas_sp.AAC.1
MGKRRGAVSNNFASFKDSTGNQYGATQGINLDASGTQAAWQNCRLRVHPIDKTRACDTRLKNWGCEAWAVQWISAVAVLALLVSPRGRPGTAPLRDPRPLLPQPAGSALLDLCCSLLPGARRRPLGARGAD